MSGEQPVVDDAGRELDRIRLTGITATGWHGLLPEERRAGQRFVADVVVHLDTRRAAARDDLTHSVDYGGLAQEVHAVLAGDPVDLIETVAERIAATVLAHPGVLAVDVAVHKPQAPIPVPFDDVVVEIRRDRHKLPAAEPYRADRAGAGPSPTSDATRAAAHAAQPRTAQLPLAEAPSALPLPAPSSALAPSAPSTPLDIPTFADVVGPDVAALAAAIPAAAPAAAAAVPGVAGAGAAPAVVGVPPSSTSSSASSSAAASDLRPDLRPDVPSSAATPPAPVPDDVSETTVLPRTPAGPPAPGPDQPPSGDVLDQRPAQPVDVVLALGSNLGPSQETLREAVAELHQLPGLEVVAVSPLARTAPVGGPEQPDYLDAVVLARTSLAPRELLHALQLLEDRHGRERHERWGPRTLDLDIVVYGSVLAVTDDLELPHPRAHQRAFVLQPWAQLDPSAVLPGLGGGPVAQLAATAPDRDGVRWMALDWLTAPVQHTGSVDVSGFGAPEPAPASAPAPQFPVPQPPAPQAPAPQAPAPHTPAGPFPAGRPDDADDSPGPAWPWGP